MKRDRLYGTGNSEFLIKKPQRKGAFNALKEYAFQVIPNQELVAEAKNLPTVLYLFGWQARTHEQTGSLYGVQVHAKTTSPGIDVYREVARLLAPFAFEGSYIHWKEYEEQDRGYEVNREFYWGFDGDGTIVEMNDHPAPRKNTAFTEYTLQFSAGVRQAARPLWGPAAWEQDIINPEGAVREMIGNDDLDPVPNLPDDPNVPDFPY